MEEELNEHDLEERLYAMLHHVDETQNNVNQASNQIDATQLFENGPRGTIRRYWRTSAETNPHSKVNTPNPHVKVNTNNPYVKINSPKPAAPVVTKTSSKPDDTKPKEETKSPTPPPTVDLSIFQSPIPQNVKKVIEIIEHEDNNQVLLESSDEDEVVEVALPPKPTITIESSDEDELSIIKPDSLSKTPTKLTDKSKNGDRAISASPVPSVVSSVSDDFIRGDCIALNISSRQPDNPSFDFSLHGPDLLIQDTPAKKKRKRKNKEAVTSTPIVAEKSATQSEECFATPKSKAKNKKKAKSNIVIQKSVPALDISDSDSNQSIIDITKGKSSYVVTEKSLPSADVYESDSNQSEVQIQVKETNTAQSKDDIISSDSSIDKENDPNPKNTTEKSNASELFQTCETVDLTDNDSFITIDNTGITESIVMANVTGFTESEDYGDENIPTKDPENMSKYVSSKVPSILNADLDFDNLKGIERVCKKRRYSLTTLRAEMEKFYNESWGGEDFNHREIQKNMSRDKNLWAIDPKDRMPSYNQRKSRCNYCNRVGHRDDACMRKPAVCYMCGNSGHFESRCPRKICVNCGAPNHMFTNICRNCSTWGHITCAECNQNGHPSSHCPDLWRRYHNTIDINMPLEKCFQTKQWAQLYCSGCSRRGHLIHTCRTTVPFANLPINSPYVCVYRPRYFPQTQDKNKQFSKSSQDTTISSATTPNRGDGKRLSKSPTAHENHSNKKRNISVGDEAKTNSGQFNKSPATKISRQNPTSTDIVQDAATTKESCKINLSKEVVSEKAPDFIPIGSTNHDNKGHVIQDNEVSDSSEVVTSARIYITEDVFEKLKTKEQDWLKETTKKLDITVQCCGGAFPFLSVKGKVGDQEKLQYLLRNKWNHENSHEKPSKSTNESNDATAPEEPEIGYEPQKNLPKNRYSLLRYLSKALDSLKQDLGDPKALHKEVTFLQNRHQKLLKQKVINPQVLSNSRTNISNMLKKLNSVLLGQAGLANGSNSLSELYSFKEKLSTLRENNISLRLRRAIGEHYYSIFSSNARDDYSELLKIYDISKPTLKLDKRKKKDKSFVPSPKIKKTSIPSQENPQNTEAGVQKKQQKNSIQMNKLIFYHQRLKKVKPQGTNHKKTKVDLVRRLHTCIALMLQNEKLTAKSLKKVKRAQTEAQNFLTTNV